MQTVKSNLNSWFKTISGLDRIIWANQSSYRPQKPYGTLNLIAFPKPVGLPERRTAEENNQGYEYLYENQSFTLSFQIYSDHIDSADDALNLMHRTSMSSHTLPNLDTLKSYNVVLVDKMQIQNVDEQLGNRWERRSQQDYLFRIRQYVKSEIDLIESVTISGSISGSNTGDVEKTVNNIN
jgi:hypothetical protein